MLRLSDLEQVGRAVRQDDWEDIGVSTPKQVQRAMKEGRDDEAAALVGYMVPEGKALHDLFCDWLWDLFTLIAGRHGEAELGALLRQTQGGWMMKRTWAGFLKLPVEARVQLTAEIMRAHRCGPDQDGDIEIVDEGDRYVLRMDPCGSGGRMRRGDPVDGTPSRLNAPYGFGCTKAAHDWSWGRTGVPYYCTHCAMNELLPMEWGGHPLWVTDYDPDPQKPCAWIFFKRSEDIAEHYYSRVGRQKPAAGQGRY